MDMVCACGSLWRGGVFPGIHAEFRVHHLYDGYLQQAAQKCGAHGAGYRRQDWFAGVRRDRPDHCSVPGQPGLWRHLQFHSGIPGLPEPGRPVRVPLRLLCAQVPAHLRLAGYRH